MDYSKFKKNRLPNSPGVYFFHGKKREIFYIGKATSLKGRVKSYFAKDLIDTRGARLVQMVERARTITFKKTDSILESLILEAKLIKEHQPPYNTAEKDDKSFNHIVITKEDYPRVLVVRGKDIEAQFPKDLLLYEIGPFPQGGILKEAIKLIRRIFPFRDTCHPYKQSPRTKNSVAKLPTPSSLATGFRRDIPRPCFNAQVSLCPGVCAGWMGKREYRRHIKNLILFFEGKKKRVISHFKKEMDQAAKALDFEKANQIKRRLYALEHIQDVGLIKRKSDRLVEDAESCRIEAYDIAHLSGGNMVGVMVVVENGEPKKSDYRKFKIRTIKKNNDPAALKEVIERRLKHYEWPLPNIIVVDGNEVQKRTVEKALKEKGLALEVVALVKNDKHKARGLIGDEKVINKNKNSIILANAESHRFAVAFHKLRRKKAFLP